MEIHDGPAEARERAPSRFKHLKKFAVPLALAGALGVAAVPALAAVVTNAWNPRVAMGNHSTGGCNEVVADLIGNLLVPHLHVIAGQESLMRAVKIHERFNPATGSSYEGRTSLQNDRGQIYGGGVIGGKLFCAGGSSNTNGQNGSGTNPAVDFLDYQNRINDPNSSAQNPIGGLEFATIQTVFGSVNGQTYRFDPIFNTFDIMDPMLTSVVGSAQRAANNELYVIGGRVAGTKVVERLRGGEIITVQVPTVEPCAGASQDIVQALDPKQDPIDTTIVPPPASKQWEKFALPAGQGRSDAAAVVVGGKILVIGGCRVEQQPVNTTVPGTPPLTVKGTFNSTMDVKYALRVAALDPAGNILKLDVSVDGGNFFGDPITRTALAADGSTTFSLTFGLDSLIAPVSSGLTLTFGPGSPPVGTLYKFTAPGAKVKFLRNIDIFDPTQPTKGLVPSGALLPSARADAAAAAKGIDVHVLGGWRTITDCDRLNKALNPCVAERPVGGIGTAANPNAEVDVLVNTGNTVPGPGTPDDNHITFQASSLDVRKPKVVNVKNDVPLNPTCTNNKTATGSNRVELVAAVIGTDLIGTGGNCRFLQGFNEIDGTPAVTITTPVTTPFGTINFPIVVSPAIPPRPAAAVNRDDSTNTDTLVLK